MSAIDFLLHESSVGYAIFEVVHQADTVGNRLKEVQDAAQDLAKFGKMVKLVNFAPYRYDFLILLTRSSSNNNLEEPPKLLKISTSSPKVFCRSISGPI
jgi:hypothetical protein